MFLVSYSSKKLYESCHTNLRFWNLAWPVSTIITWLFFISLMYVRSRVPTKTGIVAQSLLFFENMVIYAGFCYAWIKESCINSNQKCFIPQVANLQLVFIALLTLVYFISFVTICVVCTNLYCKKLKVKNEGKKFIENTYSLIENSSINKKELEELVSSQKFSDLINNTPI